MWVLTLVGAIFVALWVLGAMGSLTSTFTSACRERGLEHAAVAEQMWTSRRDSTFNQWKGSARLVACWWFGCQPDYQAMDHGCDVIPCERCGAQDTSYADKVGDTRHARLLDWLRRLRWQLIGRWLPTKCHACGSRVVCRDDCDGIPF